ncbi:MAG: hypothetical protein HQ498_03240 [Pseudohongiella sp.]|jgi:hypothetical protein|nr:hypothetical protein [Pseudohongiella sp.]
MSKIKLLIGSLASAALFYAPLSLAESIVDGTYLSEGASNGTGKCTLTIKSITQSPKYGDETFELESSGDGACEWSAIGLSKSYAITGGLVTNGGAPAFVKLKFPFGPAGKRIELTAFDMDGSVRNNEVFAKQ